MLFRSVTLAIRQNGDVDMRTAKQTHNELIYSSILTAASQDLKLAAEFGKQGGHDIDETTLMRGKRSMCPQRAGKKAVKFTSVGNARKGSPFMRSSSNDRLEIRWVLKRRMHMYKEEPKYTTLSIVENSTARVSRRSSHTPHT